MWLGGYIRHYHANYDIRLLVRWNWCANFLQAVKWQISRVHVSTKREKLKEMEEEFSVNMNEPLLNWVINFKVSLITLNRTENTNSRK